MQAFYFFDFFKQRLCIFSQKLSNENKQRLYKIQKRPTSLFYHVLLIKQNDCIIYIVHRHMTIGKSSLVKGAAFYRSVVPLYYGIAANTAICMIVRWC